MNRVHHLPIFHVHVVVEALFDGRSVAEATTVIQFHRFTHDVGSRMPEHLLSYGLTRVRC